MSTVVHVVEAAATGTLSMVCSSANVLAEQGHAVHVIYSERPETPSSLARMFHPSVQLHVLPMGGLAALAAMPRLCRLLGSLSPQVVHLHSSFAGFAGRLASVGGLASTRFFYSPHCISMMRQDIGFKRYIFAALERLAGIRPCRYLACSQSESKAISDWVGADALLLENSVDLGSLGPRMSGMSPASPLKIVCVGGIRLQKDPVQFAAIATACSDAGIACTFSWVGDGEPTMVRTLEAAGVRVLGWKPRDEIARILAESNLYLSTSRWEGMPVSLIEAMACGVPVLASRTAGNVDVVEHGRTGYLFDSARDAVSVISEIASGVRDTTAVVANGHLESRDRFSVNRYADRLREIYFG